MSRAIIVVDTETTGLDARLHDVCEVAWVALAGTASGWFVPPHSTIDADPVSLELNGYHRLRALPFDLQYRQTRQLHDYLRDNTLAGANPHFDAQFLTKLFLRAGLDPEPWHHRLLDVSAYTAGALGLEPDELPGLAKCAELLGVELDADEAHHALADAQVTAACIAAARLRAKERVAA